jgi:CRP-like cAMP-binding protein
VSQAHPLAHFAGHLKAMARKQELHSSRKRRPKFQARAVDGKAVQNVLLEQMPEAEFLALEPHLRYTEFRISEYLERQGNPIKAVYFLNQGIVSMMIETPDARSVEVGISGCEDMIGLPAVGGLYELTYSVVVQTSGDGFMVPIATAKRVLPLLPGLTRMLLRRLAIQSVEQAQSTACNRLHNLTQRLARWLLSTHDRLPTDQIVITHDFLSKMIGTDRATASLAIAEFERKGVLRRGRGSITITDRDKLQEQSCECYEIVSQFNPELGLRT